MRRIWRTRRKSVKTILNSIVAIGLLSASVLPSGKTPTAIQANICTVADPTGTPLNVRSKPKNGRVVSKLKNGTVVRVEDIYDEADPEAEDNSTAGWFKVSVTRKGKLQILGWVLSGYLNCN